MDAKINAILDQCLKALPFIKRLTLNFNLLLKNLLECSFVSFKCSLQSSNVCFEVRSEYLRWLNSKQFEVIFQKQIEIESKDQQWLAIGHAEGKGHFAFAGIFATNFFGVIGITQTIHL